MSKTLLEIMEPVLLERDKEILEQGKREGMVYAFYEMNLGTNEIAKKVQLTESEVIEILKHVKENN